MHLLWGGSISEAKSQHAELLKYCKAGDVAKAVDLLKEHILGSRDEIKELLVSRETING